MRHIWRKSLDSGQFDLIRFGMHEIKIATVTTIPLDSLSAVDSVCQDALSTTSTIFICDCR